MKGNITVKKDPVFSSREAAEMLHISKSTLYELTRRGEINFYRVGRNIRFSEEDIEAYLLRSHNRQESFVKKSFAESNLMFSQASEPDSIVLCGQDIILDVLSNYMRLNGVPTLRSYIGSFESLLSLYNDKVQVASSHLWAGDHRRIQCSLCQKASSGNPGCDRSSDRPYAGILRGGGRIRKTFPALRT